MWLKSVFGNLGSKVWLGSVCGLVLFSQATLAQETQEQAQAKIQERKDYILGNTLMTLYHEFGHTLVTELNLPVLGREEDAVDNFSIVTVAQKLGDIDAYGEEQAEQLNTYLRDAGDGWLAFAESDEEDEYAYAGEHSLDLQRFFNHTCMVFGSNPEYHSDIGEEFDIEPEILEGCEERYEESFESWNDTLTTFAEDSEDGGDIEIFVEDTDTKAHEEFVNWLENWFWLDDFQETMSQLFPLPETISVVFQDCGESNAFWDPEEREISICYELMGLYDRFYASQGS